MLSLSDFVLIASDASKGGPDTGVMIEGKTPVGVRIDVTKSKRSAATTNV
jgi:hypothetical protein